MAGTTGYEFVGALAGLFVDVRGEEPLTSAYNTFVGGEVSYRDLVIEAKRRTLTRNLAGELDKLKDMAGGLAGRQLSTRDFGTDTLRRAIIELIAALPVYRTYIDISGAHDEDKVTWPRLSAPPKRPGKSRMRRPSTFLGALSPSTSRGPRIRPRRSNSLRAYSRLLARSWPRRSRIRSSTGTTDLSP